MRKGKKIIIGIACAVVMLVTGVACGAPNVDEMDFNADYSDIKTGSVNARVSVHDPSVIKADGKYYIFGSHMVGGVTEDLRTFTRVGNGYTENNSVYGNLFEEGSHVFDYSGNKDSLIPTDDGGVHVWAPDPFYNETTGLYYLYYCTTSTWNTSNLCYGVSESVTGPYEWKGALVYSGFTPQTIGETNVLDVVSEDHAYENYMLGNDYNFRKFPNAIDPTVFYDEDGRIWMVYGSWSGGMFILELDKNTGEVIFPEADPENNVDPYFGKKLMGGGHKSIEGPYILYDEASDYYYLFVSYGSLTRAGGYQIRVFRSKTANGEYVDMNGEYFEGTGDHSDYGLKLSGNYMLPSLKRAYMATGHNSAFVDDNGKRYVVYHTRFDDGTENHSPRIKQFLVNEEGWPCMLPYATAGETVSETGYEKTEVVGRYYVINQGTQIDAKVAEPVIFYLDKSGKVYGDGVEGTWEMTGDSYYMTITYGGVSYSGVFCAMKDEAGTDVMTFSAVGNNESVWGVKYPENAQ